MGTTDTTTNTHGVLFKHKVTVEHVRSATTYEVYLVKGNAGSFYHEERRGGHTQEQLEEMFND